MGPSETVRLPRQAAYRLDETAPAIVLKEFHLWTAIHTRAWDHDSLMIAVDTPALARSKGPGARARIELALLVAGEAVDTRTITLDYVFHQFVLPVSAFGPGRPCELRALFADAEGLAGPPVLHVRLATCSRARLVEAIEARQIWIFGSPRSGSTWVSHDILSRIPGGVRPIDEMGFGRMLGTFEVEPEVFHGIGRVLEGRDHGADLDTVAGARAPAGPPLFNRLLLADYDRPETMLRQRTWPAVRQMIREATFNHVLLHWGVVGYGAVVFKAPNESHAADLIMAALPGARMIHLVRDGRDVIRSRFSPFASRVLAETKDPDLRRTACAYYAHQWNWHTDIARRAYERHDPGRRLLAEYGALRRGEPEAFRTLLAFAGADLEEEAIEALIAQTRLEHFPEAVRGPALPRQGGEIGGYARSFSAEEIRVMTLIMAGNLRRYGYRPRLAESPVAEGALAGLADRLPEEASVHRHGGVHPDGWAAQESEIVLSVPRPVERITVTGYVPRDFLDHQGPIRARLRVDGSEDARTIGEDGLVELGVPIDLQPDEIVALRVSTDQRLRPDLLGSPDRRDLGLQIVRVEAV